MKILFRLTACVLLVVIMLSVLFGSASAAESFYSEAELLKMKSNMESDAGLSKYGVIQGACSDGKYAYFAAMGSGATILKYDMNSWKLVASNKISDVGHGNDIAYNPDENILVIANNAPYYNIVTLVDADSLKVIKDVELKHKVKVKEKVKENGKEKIVEKEQEKALDIYSIAYNPDTDQYVVGISGTYDFALLDKDFKKVKQFKGRNTGYTRQGCDCDEDYIYFVQSGSGDNILVIYDYTGKYIDTVHISHAHEIENLFHIDKVFYSTLFYYGNTLQRIGFSDSTKITFKVIFDANGGDGKMEPLVVHYGEETKLTPNSFTREGYSFGGWIVRRGNDGKIVGCRNGEEDFGWLEKDEVFDYHLYSDGAIVSKLAKNGEVTMSPFWVSDYYDIYFDSDDGEGHMDPLTVGYSEFVKIPESQFVKEGFIFDGYTASRDIDGRVYGLRKDSTEAEWLNPEDLDEPYIFWPGDEINRMTYDGSVTLTSRFRFAYTFDDDGTTLKEYVGVDEVVSIPDNDGELNTLAEGAFKDNEVMTELYIPASVSSIEERSITDCPKLRNIYFEGNVPQNLDGASVKADVPPVMYRVYNGHSFCLGILGNAESVPLIRCHAELIEKYLSSYDSSKE